MDYSELISRIVGLYLVIMSLGIILKINTFKKNIEEIKQSPGALVIGSFLPTTLGLILVTTHNYWAWDWRVIITLFSWALLLKGIGLFWFKELFEKLYQPIEKNRFLYFLACIYLLFGAILIYLSLS